MTEYMAFSMLNITLELNKDVHMRTLIRKVKVDELKWLKFEETFSYLFLIEASTLSLSPTVRGLL